MNSLIEKLKTYQKIIHLDARYLYGFNFDSPLFSEQEKEELNSIENIFRRNVKLKEFLRINTDGSDKQMDWNFWIINNWGGIRTFKRNEKNLEKIKTFFKQLTDSIMTRETFNTISSLSKLASFMDPENYVIYDSRVIYAMNWLILTSGLPDQKFFPMPTGRNTKLLEFDIQTIIRLSKLEDNKTKKPLFYDYKTAYFEFCKLIKSLSKEVFNDLTIKPYYLEMLLFVIADKEIYDELTSCISIEIKTS